MGWPPSSDQGQGLVPESNLVVKNVKLETSLNVVFLRKERRIGRYCENEQEKLAREKKQGQQPCGTVLSISIQERLMQEMWWHCH